MRYHIKNRIENAEKMKARILKVLGDDFLKTKAIAIKIGYGDRPILIRRYLQELEQEGKVVHQLGYFPKWTAC